MNLELVSLLTVPEEESQENLTEDQVYAIELEGLQAALEISYICDAYLTDIESIAKVCMGMDDLQSLIDVIKKHGIDESLLDMFKEDIALVAPEILEESPDQDKVVSSMEGALSSIAKGIVKFIKNLIKSIITYGKKLVSHENVLIKSIKASLNVVEKKSPHGTTATILGEHSLTGYSVNDWVKLREFVQGGAVHQLEVIGTAWSRTDGSSLGDFDAEMLQAIGIFFKEKKIFYFPGRATLTQRQANLHDLGWTLELIKTEASLIKADDKSEDILKKAPKELKALVDMVEKDRPYTAFDKWVLSPEQFASLINYITMTHRMHRIAMLKQARIMLHMAQASLSSAES